MKIGQALVVKLPFHSNGSELAPAIVTRTWNPGMVNLVAFPDCGSPICFTSVVVVPDEASAMATGMRPVAWPAPRD